MSVVDADPTGQAAGGDRRMIIRPMRMQDVAMERRYIHRFSWRAACFRFLESMRAPGMARLRTLTAFDPETDVGFVAMTVSGSVESPIGVARFNVQADHSDCEFAVSVADRWRHKGLGTLLMQRLIEAARTRGIETMHSSAACDNEPMRRFAEHLRLGQRRDPDDARQMLYTIDVRARENAQPAGLVRENLE
jgi:GNAT superfamily N-acetyltransferase